MYNTTILIHEIAVNCFIGVSRTERLIKQTLLISVELTLNTKKASITDMISDTVDYKRVYDEIITHTEDTSVHLLETLARQICDICLQYKQVKKVKIQVTKKNRLPKAKHVTVMIEKSYE
jgi:dihydroneopterin aldolase